MALEATSVLLPPDEPDVPSDSCNFDEMSRDWLCVHVCGISAQPIHVGEYGLCRTYTIFCPAISLYTRSSLETIGTCSPLHT